MSNQCRKVKIISNTQYSSPNLKCSKLFFKDENRCCNHLVKRGGGGQHLAPLQIFKHTHTPYPTCYILWISFITNLLIDNVQPQFFSSTNVKLTLIIFICQMVPKNWRCWSRCVCFRIGCAFIFCFFYYYTFRIKLLLAANKLIYLILSMSISKIHGLRSPHAP